MNQSCGMGKKEQKKLVVGAVGFFKVLLTLATSVAVPPTALWSRSAATQGGPSTQLAGDSFTVADASLCAEISPKNQLGAKVLIV